MIKTYLINKNADNRTEVPNTLSTTDKKRISVSRSAHINAVSAGSPHGGLGINSVIIGSGSGEASAKHKKYNKTTDE